MDIIVLDCSTGEVYIEHNVPKGLDNLEEYLCEVCEYNLDNIEWMSVDKFTSIGHCEKGEQFLVESVCRF